MLPLQVGVKAFLKNKDGKYLLVRRAPENRHLVNGIWDVVGGRIEPGTDLITNLAREVEEETGLVLTSSPQLFLAQDIIRADKQVVRLSYLSTADGKVKLSPEHDAFLWLTVAEMAKQEDLDEFVASALKEKVFE
ncbi:MAG: NUDIX domain-containing protein [Patescibacteria group bacterium]